MVFVFGEANFAYHRARQAGGGELGTNFFVTHFDDKFVSAVGFAHGWPLGQQRTAFSAELRGAFLGQIDRGFGGFGALWFVLSQHPGCGIELLCLPREFGLLAHTRFVFAHRFRNLRQVTHPGSRHDGGLVGAVADLCHGQQTVAFREGHTLVVQDGADCLVQGSHAVVIETRSHGAEDGHVFVSALEVFAVA